MIVQPLLKNLIAAVLCVYACGDGGASVSPSPTAPSSSGFTVTPVVTASNSPAVAGVLIGAGDISTCRNNHDEATARLLDQHDGVVFTTGDNVYDDGTAQEFQDCYGPTWGRHRGRTRPSPGNHEYVTPGAAGYFGYFGANAGNPGEGYYSYDVAGWHILSLNSNIGARPGSAQYEWVRAELASNRTACAAAYWHHPLFSSGDHGSYSKMREIWRLLQEHGVEVILSGHDHNYERFAPQTADGRADPERGIRQFVVGTGGRDLDPFKRVLPNSEVREAGTFGVLKLTLRSAGYDWEFLPVSGGSFRDSGSGVCR